jgi:hypothetical protein
MQWRLSHTKQAWSFLVIRWDLLMSWVQIAGGAGTQIQVLGDVCDAAHDLVVRRGVEAEGFTAGVMRFF